MEYPIIPPLIKQHLLEKTAAMESGRRSARIAAIFCVLFELYFITVVVSLFLGFLNMFPFHEIPTPVFAYFIKGFMFFVLTIVVVGLINKQVRIQLGERAPEALKNRGLVLSITIVLSAAALAAGYIIGTTYLHLEFGLLFFLRWFLAIISIFVVMLPYYRAKSVRDKYQNAYRNMFIQESISGMGKAISYDQKNYISKEIFVESDLFPCETIFMYSGSDMFHTTEQTFSGSRLDVKQKEVHTSNGKTETKVTDLFKGYFFTAPFNKKIHGETFVFPDLARSFAGELYGEMINSFVKRKNLQLVRLEDPDFERDFAVYATDPVEARYILSTSFVERINAFKKLFYQDVYFSFRNDVMYVAVKTDVDLIKPALFGNAADAHRIEKQYGQLQALLTLPEHFVLDRRIWEKGGEL